MMHGVSKKYGKESILGELFFFRHVIWIFSIVRVNNNTEFRYFEQRMASEKCHQQTLLCLD
jgi:hypothetical protein